MQIKLSYIPLHTFVVVSGMLCIYWPSTHSVHKLLIVCVQIVQPGVRPVHAEKISSTAYQSIFVIVYLKMYYLM